ncbi:hypothetical protein B0T13DRAFT_450044 [Neurospora crassa]|nr:hypothetical protein B0T13DRAFT_450044 [Neurospora crassa]
MLVEPVQFAKVAVATWKESRKTHEPIAPNSGGDHDTLRFSPRPTSPTSRSDPMALWLLEHPVSGSNASPVLQVRESHHSPSHPHIAADSVSRATPWDQSRDRRSPTTQRKERGCDDATVHHTTHTQQRSAVSGPVTRSPRHNNSPSRWRYDKIPLDPPIRGKRKFGLVRRTAERRQHSSEKKKKTRHQRGEIGPPGTELRFCVFFDDDVVDVLRLRPCTASPQCSRNPFGVLDLGVLALETGR